MLKFERFVYLCNDVLDDEKKKKKKKINKCIDNELFLRLE